MLDNFPFSHWVLSWKVLEGMCSIFRHTFIALSKLPSFITTVVQCTKGSKSDSCVVSRWAIINARWWCLRFCVMLATTFNFPKSPGSHWNYLAVWLTTYLTESLVSLLSRVSSIPPLSLLQIRYMIRLLWPRGSVFQQKFIFINRVLFVEAFTLVFIHHCIVTKTKWI